MLSRWFTAQALKASSHSALAGSVDEKEEEASIAVR